MLFSKLLIPMSVALVLSGCGDAFESGISGGESSTKSDSVSVESTGALSFKVVWDKKSSSYSEVVVTDIPGSSEERGQSFVTDNSTGKHTLNCYYYGRTDASSSSFLGSESGDHEFRCEGTGPSLFGGSREIKGRVILDEGKTYHLRVNYGFDYKHGDVTHTLRHANSSVTITEVGNKKTGD